MGRKEGVPKEDRKIAARTNDKDLRESVKGGGSKGKCERGRGVMRKIIVFNQEEGTQKKLKRNKQSIILPLSGRKRGKTLESATTIRW